MYRVRYFEKSSLIIILEILPFSLHPGEKLCDIVEIFIIISLEM